jgi:hypothetical protein
MKTMAREFWLGFGPAAIEVGSRKRLPRDLEATFASNNWPRWKNSVRLGFQFRSIA